MLVCFVLVCRSGALSRSEFLALYLLVSTHRIVENPVVLAEALLGFLDSDRNGKIEGKELKVRLCISVPMLNS